MEAYNSMEAVNKDSDLTQSSSLKPSSFQSIPVVEGTVLLERYMLMRLIGRGGTSLVYRARDLLAVLGGDEAESHVAIKVVRAAEESGQQDSQLMLREALTTRHLSHKNILKVYDFHRDGDVSFVTMELVEGESLADFLVRLPGKKMSFRRALPIIKAISSALQYAHDQGVIHSDIKPSNVLITEQGDIKVIDFATARSYMDARVKGLKFDHDPKFYGYTLAYASPQTIADEPAKPNDDVFSFACIIHEILTGTHPYSRKPTNTIPTNFKLSKPKEISFSQWWVLRRALALNAASRFDSVDKFTRFFTHAGKATQYGLIFASLVVASIWGGSHLYDYASEFRHQADFEKAAYAKSKSVDLWVQQIKALPWDKRIGALNGLASLEAENQQIVLALVYPDVVTATEERAVRALNYSMSGEAIPDFSTLAEQAEQALAFYPDSHVLVGISTRIELEREQLLSAFAIQLRGAWQQVEFTLADGKNISQLINRLQHLSRDISVLPGADVITRYEESITAAIEESDFKSIYQLNAFAEIVNQIDTFAMSWQKYDAAMPIAAKSLMDYQMKGSVSTAMPQDALAIFVEPYFAKLNRDIGSAWLDKDIIALHEKLEDAAIRFGLGETAPMLLEAKEALIDKVSSKMAYHQQKDNLKSLRQLQLVFDDSGAVVTAHSHLQD